jgi:tRNA A37 N6-isopentenylltransferase MiaA
VERIARRLAAGVEDGLRREVEQLTDKLRAAEARLATLEARVTA